MTVELISVGTEILLGNIVNTNAAYLAEKLAALGLSCYYQGVVGDNEERLEGALKQALDRSDIVILGGGLGPTKDDLTKEVAANYVRIRIRESVFRNILTGCSERIRLQKITGNRRWRRKVQL